MYPEWLRAEGIRAFAGQPLVFRGEILGLAPCSTPLSHDEALLGLSKHECTASSVVRRIGGHV